MNRLRNVNLYQLLQNLFDMHQKQQNQIEAIIKKRGSLKFSTSLHDNSSSLSYAQQKGLSKIKAPMYGYSDADMGQKWRKSEHKMDRIANYSKQLDRTPYLTNFNHHGDETCLCNNCSCGRHLCKIKAIKPNLKKVSVYQNLYQYKKPLEMKVVTTKQTTPLQASHLDLRTNYRKQYRQTKIDKLQRPKPEDGLKFNGPTPNITTYGSSFIGHHGDNQYVKPTNKHKMGDFPLIHKTVYSTEFVRKISKSNYEKQDDSFKLGKSWLGSSTYNNSFCAPNPQNYIPSEKRIEKASSNLKYSHQFETNYKNEFVQKQSPLCPSTIFLKLGASKKYQNSKHLFRQNSDYKSLSPDFKAISTSKHFFI